MRDFLRRLFGAPDPNEPIPVSVPMAPLAYARLCRLAEHTGQPGALILDLALREWLREHEEALLDGTETFREVRRSA